MIRHVALFRFDSDAADDRLVALMADFKGLEGRIEGLEWVSAGTNVTGEPYDRGFRHGIVMTFATRADLETYLDHPLHVPLAKRVIAALANGPDQDIAVFDIEA